MPSIYEALVAPLKLPLRVLESLDLADEAAREIRPIHSELAQVREQTKPLAEVPPGIDRLEKRIESLQGVVGSLEGEESHLNKAVMHLAAELSKINESLTALQDDVERITDRLPDPDKSGPIAKARDALTGS